MPELSARIAALSPERRRILEKLRSSRGSDAVPDASFLAPEDDPGGYKRAVMSDYDGYNRSLDATAYGPYSWFLNYGYVPDGSPTFSVRTVPDQYINRNSVRLMLEVIGDAPIEGCEVLDVGCGRGGMVHVLCTLFEPRRVAGMDLSPVAVQFCRANHKYKQAEFSPGDAENIPFSDESFDVVTNVESSCCYPNISAFYRGVYRVLRPGGRFLYTDCLPVLRMSECIAFLKNLGFVVERETDITRNVLLSCDEVAAIRSGAYGGAEPEGELGKFLGVPGTENYERMRTGQWTYRILKLRKPEVSSANG